MKLSYTFYFNDWASSVRVRRLTLPERAIYRELIDLYYKEEGNVTIDDFFSEDWAYLYRSTKDEIELIIKRLIELELINIKGKKLLIPSCDTRIDIMKVNRKNGQKGGENKAKNKQVSSEVVAKSYRNSSEVLADSYQSSRQRERERERERENKGDTSLEERDWYALYSNSLLGDLNTRKKRFEVFCMTLIEKNGHQPMINFYNHFTEIKEITGQRYYLFETIKGFKVQNQFDLIKAKL